MKYKEKVISNIDSIINQMTSLKNMVENDSITKNLFLSELNKLITRLEYVNDIIGLEDTDFSTLIQGIKK